MLDKEMEKNATPYTQLGRNSMFANTDMKAISEWTDGKNFGMYKGHRTLENGINILSHTGGFAVFFPPEIFHKFDYTVPISRPKTTEGECWIAGKGFGFVKVDVTLEQLKTDEHKKYIADDPKAALDKIEEFVNKNFRDARGLYPDSESTYFTHGSVISNPNMMRPFRFRMGGDYNITF